MTHMERAIDDYIGARFRAETETMRQAVYGDDNADIVGCARAERDQKFKAMIAAVRADVDVQVIAAIAWRCIRECKDYEGPPVMCPAHQEEAKAKCYTTVRAGA